MDEDQLARMREGDVKASKLEMTAVVPVSGLVLGRFQIHTQEHNTFLEMWGMSLEKKDGFFFFFFW